MLLQRVLAAVDLPVWAQGGIGLRGAAAVLTADAADYVLDTQLALLRESSTPEELAAVVRTMHGSETKIIDGCRLLARPGFALKRDRAPTSAACRSDRTPRLPERSPSDTRRPPR